MVNVYGELIMEEFKDATYMSRQERNKVLNQIDVLNDKLNKARRKMLFEELDPADFKLMKMNCEREINALESQVTQLPYETKTIEGITKRA